MTEPTIQDWLWAEVMCVQAIIGSVSQNFRQIILSYEGDEWIISVTLEKSNDDDLEEVSDIVDEFSAFLEDIKDQLTCAAYSRVRSVINVTCGKLIYDMGKNGRVIFRRKEK